MITSAENKESDERISINSQYLQPLPDGGYGWIICICSFVIFLVTDGFIFSFGIIFIELLDYFHESKSKTAMVGSILAGGPLLFGPLISTLINRWGIRLVAMAGAIVTTASLVASVVAPSVEVLIFTYGVMGGLAIGLMYLPATLIIGFYFDKRRAFATGLATCGSGIGIFVFPPLCIYLIDEYGWRGALLIVSGIFLQCLICAALYRPVHIKKKAKDSNLTFDSVKVGALEIVVSEEEFQDKHDRKKMLQNDQSMEKKNSLQNNDNSKLQSIRHRNAPGIGQLTEKRRNDSVQEDIEAKPKEDQLVLKHSNDKNESEHDPGYVDDIKFRNSLSNHQMPESDSTDSSRLYSKVDKSSPSGNDVADSENAYKEVVHLNNDDELHTELTESLMTNNINTLSKDINNEASAEDVKYSYKSRRNLCEKIHSSLPGLILMKNPAFLICVVMSSFWTAQCTVLTILPNHVNLNGISEKDASLLVSIIGITNIFGRLSSGYLADRFDCMLVNGMAMFFGAISNFVFPFTNNFILLAASAGLFGVGMGGWVTLRPIVLVDIVGLNRVTDAFGILAFFQGIAMCSGPPFAGLLFQLTGSYELPFLVVALGYLLGAAICIPMRKLSPKRSQLE